MGRRRAVSKSGGKGGRSKRRKTSVPNPKKDEKGKSTGEENAAEISKPEAETSGSAVHPLLIDHVLEKIFQHIISPKTDDQRTTEAGVESSESISKNVQNLRLVCKQWKDIATRVFRRNRPQLMPIGSMWTSSVVSKSLNTKVQNFLDVMKSSKLIPIQRYYVNPRFFINENQQLMKDFMRICGPDAVELRLCWDNTCTMKFIPRSGTFPDLNLKELKKLVFWCNHETSWSKKQEPYPTDEIVYLIEAVLGEAESLQEFQLTFVSEDALYSSRPAVVWPQALTTRFAECISKRIPKSVKILHLNMPLNDLHLNTLAESELKLEEFLFDSQCGASGKVIHKFFEKQAKTLKVLKILVGRSGSPISLIFPRFDELRHLELQGATIQNFSFPDIFPKLTSLNIAEWKTESTCVELLNSTQKEMSLTEIHLPYRFHQAPLMVKKAASCFPNISKLHIPPSYCVSRTLQEVFAYYDNIEELSIIFPKCIDCVTYNADSIFSGIPSRDCKKIMQQRNFDDMSFRNFKKGSSILSLTKLKKLVLHNCSYDIMLTDFSVRFLFLKMASLKELHIHCGHCRISTECVDLLREKLSLKLITYHWPAYGFD